MKRIRVRVAVRGAGTGTAGGTLGRSAPSRGGKQIPQAGHSDASIASQRRLDSHWGAFHEHGLIHDDVRPEIAASWQRSVESAVPTGLTSAPVDSAARRIATGASSAQQQFAVAAQKLGGQLLDELGDAAVTIVACDDFGVVLHRTGSRAALHAADRVGLSPGGVWSERTAGTNAIGLALALGGPARVHGAEHHLRVLHGISCAAAVVRSPGTGEPLGAIGLATDVSAPTLGSRSLMSGAARELERLLEDSLFGRERELMRHHLRHRSARDTRLLTVDRAGHLVIQDPRSLQSTSGDDVQQLLSVARHALRAGVDAGERLELNRGTAQVRVQLIRAGGEAIGAHVLVAQVHQGSAPALPPVTLAGSPLVGRSPAMQRLLREAARVARRRMTVAIRGGPGSGKLVLAEHLHELGGGGPMTVVHCAGTEWEEEWEEALARGGSIVLRRVHALAPDAQLRLCDRIDTLDASGRRAWLMSLANIESPPLGTELGTRLSRVTLAVPALRDRVHDLRLLIENWCDDAERVSGARPILRPETHDALAAQPWPGNVRELHNTLDAAALRGGTVIGVEALTLESAARVRSSEDVSLRAVEREAIEAALARHGGNVSAAATQLGIGRATLHRRLRGYRLMTGEDPRFAENDTPARRR